MHGEYFRSKTDDIAEEQARRFFEERRRKLGTAPYVNYQGNISMILEERGNAALDSFRQACEEAGVTCETCQVTGNVPRCIVEKGELADLIVMGAYAHGEWREAILGGVTHYMLDHADLPLLMRH